ncbi:twin-arginine translocase TatA/TatE family subunit [Acidiferrimicrobium sp. IK]|uniref:twin-arginine translocase TatA/TatE family subunit n=1 Tax=Acidiferrimicrobium sp. IK TaxID=2871700 RepID=UPI0021CB8470|nr:twin-arginine translocase TatA/TatE family subunit [Acidiferrimicrobium sp. IK]MCU4184672.1 twin-arginine translocase TatA/TatE family subunit [Acidiferrimicrobium sp. IK]
MFNLDPEKLLVIGIFALVVLGPNRLPDAARSAGRLIAQLRRMSGSLQSEVRDALAEPRQALQHAVDEFGISEVRSSMTAVSDPFRPSTLADGLRSSPGPAARPVPPVAGGGDPTVVPDDPSFN